MMGSVNIAIDGPSGAGKSTISREIARRLGLVYVDTGALYRAVGLYAFEAGISRDEIKRIVDMLCNIVLDIKYVDSEQRIILNGRDVSDEIRKPEISMYASDVSALPKVREFLFDIQKDLARANNAIMDGRDIGTVVLPDAQLKIFLTASVQERAKRRLDELKLRKIEAEYEQVLEEMKQRDENDSKRAVAPLRPADDAVILDTTGNTFEMSLNEVMTLISERLSDVL